MPVQFLSKADHERLNRCPDEVTQDDLDAYFQLNTEDLKVTANLRGNANRLDFALQLCCLRYLGFFPATPHVLNQDIIGYVSSQLAIAPDALLEYASREPTLYNHQQQILAHLNYRRATPVDLLVLDAWLIERALEHTSPKVIFFLACDYLRRNRIIRPGTTRLAKRVARARRAASHITFERLSPFLTETRRAFLDHLLDTDSETVSKLAWLQRTPISNRTRAINETLDKIAFLKENSVNTWSLAALNPNRRKWLAKKAAKGRVNALQNLSAEARYPLLAAFAYEALITFTDALLDMIDARLWELHGECRLAFRKDRLAATKAINETMTILRKLDERYLGDASVPAPTDEEVRAALSNADTLTRPEDDAYTDYFAKRHRQVQNFSKRLLEAMTFQHSSDDGGLLTGVDLIREIHSGERRKLPAGTPTAFIPSVWEGEVFSGKGLNWRSYEIAALWVLRERLRSGDVYVTSSRRYLELERYLISQDAWPEERRDVVGLLGAPLAAAARLSERTLTFERLTDKVTRALAENNGKIRQEGGRLIVSPVEADEDPSSLTALHKLIDERLPRIDITELLIEVDNRTSFSEAFHHLDGVATRGKSLLAQLYACILAQACNLGFKQMAASSDLPYRSLLWCNRWYLREETLDEAVTMLVNYHHALPLSSLWGGGVLSSSDGQRFPVKGVTRKARALPRYFGYGKGVTSYTWTSDQLSQFGAKVIPSTVRDATYVLDAILDNETELDIGEHTTDTAGYTELIFGLFGMLGPTFSPRIRDLADQQLYRPADTRSDLGVLRPHLNKVLNSGLIKNTWDEMLKVAMSLKKGYCTASLFISKLQAYPRQHRVTRALQEYGRLEKTIHILRWYADVQTRKRVTRQLNKGEALHDLRRSIAFGKLGEIPSKTDEALDHQFACLNLVTNAIIVYNTVHIARIAEELKREGVSVSDEDLARVWPSRHAHINFLGKYLFDPGLIRDP